MAAVSYVFDVVPNANGGMTIFLSHRCVLWDGDTGHIGHVYSFDLFFVSNTVPWGPDIGMKHRIEHTNWCIRVFPIEHNKCSNAWPLRGASAPVAVQHSSVRCHKPAETERICRCAVSKGFREMGIHRQNSNLWDVSGVSSALLFLM